MHILLLGKRGQLGFELNRQLAPDYELTSLDSSQLDLTRPEEIRTVIKTIKPDLLINAAAYTAVDKAETDQEQAFAVNAHAPEVMAVELAKFGGAMIHYSTDYVFDGAASKPYRETDKPNPQSVYGQSKLLGEQAIQNSSVAALIFRTSWVFGEYGSNFLLTMRKLMQERVELSVVDDQVGAPTWTFDLAKATVLILQQFEDSPDWAEKTGLYHMSSAGQTSWYDFAIEIARQLQQQGKQVAQIRPISTVEYPTAAQRPAYSILDNSLLAETFSINLPEWQSFFKNHLSTESVN